MKWMHQPLFSLGWKNDRGRKDTCSAVDRQVTCEHSEMMQRAVDFYKTLYAAENCDPACVGDIFEGLLELSSTQRS